MFENLNIYETIGMVFGLGALLLLVAFLGWILFGHDRYIVSDEIDE